MASTLLVSGFVPFGAEARNPSGEIAARLDGVAIGSARIAGLVLPVERRRAVSTTLDAISRLRPAAVIALGLGADRSVVCVERFAHNRDDFRMPDHAGDHPRDEPIEPGGPFRMTTSLPVEALAGAVRDAGVPAAVSEDAGCYVCNHLYYRLLRRPGTPRTVFLHLPPLPGAPERATMTLEAGERGVRAALARLADFLAD